MVVVTNPSRWTKLISSTVDEQAESRLAFGLANLIAVASRVTHAGEAPPQFSCAYESLPAGDAVTSTLRGDHASDSPRNGSPGCCETFQHLGRCRNPVGHLRERSRRASAAVLAKTHSLNGEPAHVNIDGNRSRSSMAGGDGWRCTRPAHICAGSIWGARVAGARGRCRPCLGEGAAGSGCWRSRCGDRVPCSAGRRCLRARACVR